MFLKTIRLWIVCGKRWVTLLLRSDSVDSARLAVGAPTWRKDGVIHRVSRSKHSVKMRLQNLPRRM